MWTIFSSYDDFMIVYPFKAENKKVCVSGYPAVPNFSPPTLKFFKDFVGISQFCRIVFLLIPYKNF